MRIIGIILGLVFILSSTALAQQWRELKGDHFLIYYLQDESFARDVLRWAEKYYSDIADELGYPRYSGFWTWENRAKIYIYADKDSFLKASGQQNWSEGMADYQSRSITSYAWNKDFTEALLPHEMTHLIFRDYVGFKGEIPLWLDEGVAQWMEPKKRAAVRPAIKDLLERNKLLSIEQMLTMNIQRVQDADTARTFYIEAMSLVDFLINKYGSNDFIAFCRQLRDGKSFEEALQFAYPVSLRTITDLQTRWLEYIKSGG